MGGTARSLQRPQRNGPSGGWVERGRTGTRRARTHSYLIFFFTFVFFSGIKYPLKRCMSFRPMIKVMEVKAMIYRKRVSVKGNYEFKKISWILTVSLFALFFVLAGTVACKKKAAETQTPEQQGQVIKQGANEFEGVAKVTQGKYLYVPAAQGLDIVAQGQFSSGDLSALAGKEVKVKGQISPQIPSIFLAETIEVKEGVLWKNVFTKSGEPVLEDYLDPKDRDAFVTLKDLSVDKADGWEGKGKAKIYGKLVKTTVTEGGAQKEMTYISLFDDKGKETGRIIIDRFTDYAQYYIKKLRLFDKFWFYFNIKESVDAKTRRKTKELFHAEVVFTGLF
jgi:hypothetical protein